MMAFEPFSCIPLVCTDADKEDISFTQYEIFGVEESHFLGKPSSVRTSFTDSIRTRVSSLCTSLRSLLCIVPYSETVRKHCNDRKTENTVERLESG